MSGYNRSCSRTDSSILLSTQCAAALSMMPASAPSCWAQGVIAASYKEYVIWASPSGGIFVGELTGEARSCCQPVLSFRELMEEARPSQLSTDSPAAVSWFGFAVGTGGDAPGRPFSRTAGPTR